MRVAKGEKFSAIALSGASTDLSELVELPGSLWVMPSTPVEFDETWTEWQGSIRSSHVSKANLVILATSPSKTLRDIDKENKDLESAVLNFFYGILFLGVPEYGDAHVFTGANYAGEPDIRETGQLVRHYASGGRTFVFSREHAVPAHSLCLSLQNVWQTEGKYRRLKRGLDAFVRATREPSAYSRIHQWCRSLEALVLPVQGRTEKQFTDRCQTFVDATGFVGTFNEIYRLRCKVEHLHEFDDYRADLSTDDRQSLLETRTRQAEAVARAAYQRILLNPLLLELFQDDESIRAFWKQPSDCRFRRWGERERVDLS